MRRVRIALFAVQRLVAIVFERSAPRTEIWRAMYGIASFRQAEGKWIVAVNDDIDPGNGDALFWAMCYRTRPQRDVEILKNQHEGHGPRRQVDSSDAAVLIDATLKEPYPPVAMPKREYMEKAAEIWDELGLPALTPEKPWYGYDLGEWNEEFEIMAQRAVKSDYWETGKIFAQRRRKDVEMNTEIRSLKDEDED